MYFNPRTRVECDMSYIQKACKPEISIHALVQSATKGQEIGTMGTTDFNPRTRVECDGFVATYQYGYANFNPRTRVECD